jgi:hypothetical protein
LAAIADSLQLAPESARKHASVLSASRELERQVLATAQATLAQIRGEPGSGDPIRGFLWALAFVAPLWVWLMVWLLT